MRTHAAIIAVPLFLFGLSAHAETELDVLAGATLGEPSRFVDIDGEGNTVVAGATTLVRVDTAGDPTGPVVPAGITIDAMAVDPGTGSVVVAGDDRVLRFGPDSTIEWQSWLPPLDGASVLGVGERGSIAVTSGHGVELLRSSGEAMATISVDDRERVASIAVLDTDALVVLGGSGSGDLDRAVLAAYDTKGVAQWRWIAGTDAARGAARVVDVTRGDDGMIYALAEIEDGGFGFDDGKAVEIDDATDLERIESPVFTYYARLETTGEIDRAQYLGFADSTSMVEPVAIAADRDGNVHIVGTTTHSIAEPDEVAGEAEIVDALATPSGFYQVVSADFGRRLAWKQLDLDEGVAEIGALALAGDRVVTLVHYAGATDLVAWPAAQDDKTGKRPDRDDVGTFGYESGVAGADPTCYCDASRPARGWFAFAGMFVVLGLRRRRT